MMNRKLKVTIFSVFVIALGVLSVYGLAFYKQKSADRLVEEGMQSESRGDTEAALSSYKSALDLCAPSDSRCRTDMDMKVKLMEEALKSEQSSKTGEPASDSQTPVGDEVMPDESGLKEN